MVNILPLNETTKAKLGTRIATMIVDITTVIRIRKGHSTGISDENVLITLDLWSKSNTGKRGRAYERMQLKTKRKLILMRKGPGGNLLSIT